MTAAPASTAETGALARPARRHHRRRLLAAGAVTLAALVGAGAALAVIHPFGGASPSTAGVVDNGAATGLATVSRRALTRATSVGGTLKYGGSSTVVAPTGTTQQALTQARQQVAQAQAALAADQIAASDSASATSQTISQDQSAVDATQSQLDADRASQTGDCAGTAPAAAQTCNADKQAVSGDQARLTQARNALAVAQSQSTQSRHQSDARISADRAALQNAQNALAGAQASAVNPGTVYTALPAVGQTVSRGQPLYSVSGVSVPLLFGAVTPWRDLALGVDDGPDVGELTGNLIALGFGAGLAQGNHFSADTQAAVERWQASIGAPRTGIVRLGDAVFQPGAVIVTSVTPSVGAGVQPGAAILQVTSTTREVVVNLDAAQQSEVKAGDRVTITLPDNRRTDGTVASVGTVATAPSNGSGNNGGNNNSTPTVEVDITLADPSATGNLDQAPVEVAIVTGSVDSALVVPVTALVALADGGYAVEVVDAHGTHRLVALTPGLFDDTDGDVAVIGSGLAAGDQIVVPSS